MSSEVKDQFIYTLDQLKQAAIGGEALYTEKILEEATKLIDGDNLPVLLELAEQYDQAGIFKGGPWENPRKLQARLVGGSFGVDGSYPIFEILSELRMLAIAKGDYAVSEVSPEFAKEFLNKVMALNLDLLFPKETEESRVNQNNNLERAHKLFRFLSSQLSLSSFAATLVDELDRLTAQRPIMVNRIVSIINHAKNMMSADIKKEEQKEIGYYIDAITTPSDTSKQYPDIADYQSQLTTLGTEEINREAKQFAESMRSTGLVSPHHAVLLRFLNEVAPEEVSTAMGLSEKGRANVNEHPEIVNQLIKSAIHPETCQSLYGLALMLERGALSHTPVIPGLERILELELLPEVQEVLFAAKENREELTANGILISGILSVLGQPLSIGQGMNPTCQSARGLSLWAQHDPGYLLELVARAGRDGEIDMMFEGTPINSRFLMEGLAPNLHVELDPVSLLLVPHLDRVYNEMMKRVAIRGGDGHKWTNPEFYGQWIPNEFSSVINSLTGSVNGYDDFVRLFYVTHHPLFNGGHHLIYPSPVGIFVTTANADLLGLHAISIQRVAPGPNGEYRVYFYNPNNDSAQNWGQGIRSTVRENGEEEGEASLPFAQFVSRMYAFHYNPNEMGEKGLVDAAEIAQITTLAKESWGKKYTWIELGSLYPQ
ncbi:hypothetical protein VBD025_04890 [Virgibacillus flavescens]|uniref:hypothetical protein n=1 Tax=Virgibacillus flavescens TaxID=1611422 RepID=UPI003D334AFC